MTAVPPPGGKVVLGTVSERPDDAEPGVQEPGQDVPPAEPPGGNTRQDERACRFVAQLWEPPSAASWCATHDTAAGHCPEPAASPVPDDGTREAVADELINHRERPDVIPGSGLRVGCTCGWTGNCYLHGYGDPAAHREWDLHFADALLAVVHGTGGQR